MRPFRLLLINLIFLFVLETVSAHPHMAIYSRIELSFNGENPEGLWMEYRFDRYFSADILAGFDLDQNMIFDASETQEVHDYAFINMENYGFFLYIRHGGHRESPAEVSQFSLRAEDGFVTYRFCVDLKTIKEHDFSLSVFDPTYFCACSYEEETPVSFSGTPQEGAAFSLVENKEYPVYYDPFAPVGDDTVYEKWRPGLETAYPEEVRVVY